MLNTSQLNDLLEGIALLEYFGNLYEYAGMEGGKYIFQCVSDDSYIKVTPENLQSFPECDMQHRRNQIMRNGVKHWTADGFGNAAPPLNVDDICNAANRMLDAFAQTGAAPDEIDAYSAELWDEYCTTDEINGVKSVWG